MGPNALSRDRLAGVRPANGAGLFRTALSKSAQKESAVFPKSPLENRKLWQKSLMIGIAAAFATITTAAWAGDSEKNAPGQPGIERTPAPAGAEVYLISPKDGAVVQNPFTVRFGLENAGVAPAGVDQPKTGHHHLVIDAPLPDPGMPIPSSDHYRHFGGGQTEVLLDLPPGQHTLQLVLGDYRHIPHDPAIVSKPITITVKAAD